MQLAKDTLSDFPRIRKRLAAATRDLNWYDRDELYEGRGKRKHLSRRVVSEQIALLLASFANLKPGSPEEFSHMTVKEVYANDPNAVVLESACRRLRRTEEFVSVAAILKAIETENTAWAGRWEMLEGNIADYWQAKLGKTIGKAGSMIAKAKTKLVDLEAAEAKRQARREAYARIPEARTARL